MAVPSSTPTCPVPGCGRPAVGPPTSYRKVAVLLCARHRGEYTRDRRGWEGELDPTGRMVTVLRPARHTTSSAQHPVHRS